MGMCGAGRGCSAHFYRATTHREGGEEGEGGRVGFLLLLLPIYSASASACCVRGHVQRPQCLIHLDAFSAGVLLAEHTASSSIPFIHSKAVVLPCPPKMMVQRAPKAGLPANARPLHMGRKGRSPRRLAAALWENGGRQ
jgi:hypothetical protein